MECPNSHETDKASDYARRANDVDEEGSYACADGDVREVAVEVEAGGL